MSPRRRPRWWPEGEAWPPADGQWPPTDGHWQPGSRHWSHRRGGFRRPLGCIFALLVVLATGALTAGIWTLAAIVGLVSAPPIVVAGGIVALILVVVLGLTAGRTFRATVGPIDDLVEAAARIEAGDYSARVTERGTPPMRGLTRAFNGMTARLSEMDTQRRAFLADVAHELRTPLSVIEAQLGAIEDGVYPADAAHLAPVHEQVRALERLIDDLRTVALAEAGAVVVAKEPTDLAALADETAAAFRPRADVAGVALEVDTETAAIVVPLDPARIRQVLANLLDNAVRHTPAGGKVRVEVSRQEESAVVAVTDTGAGIAPELLPRVFDRFAKGEGSVGSGLGLAIARDLVEAHGGQISAASTPGQGTTMSFTLPLG